MHCSGAHDANSYLFGLACKTRACCGHGKPSATAMRREDNLREVAAATDLHPNRHITVTAICSGLHIVGMIIASTRV